MSRLQALRECEYTRKTRTCTCYSVETHTIQDENGNLGGNDESKHTKSRAFKFIYCKLYFNCLFSNEKEHEMLHIKHISLFQLINYSNLLKFQFANTNHGKSFVAAEYWKRCMVLHVMKLDIVSYSIRPMNAPSYTMHFTVVCEPFSVFRWLAFWLRCLVVSVPSTHFISFCIA